MNRGTPPPPQMSPGGSATRLVLLHFLFPVWFGAPALLGGAQTALVCSNMDGGQTQPTSPGNPEEDGGGAAILGGGEGEEEEGWGRLEGGWGRVGGGWGEEA